MALFARIHMVHPECPTAPQHVRNTFKLFDTLEKSTFPGWNQLSDSLAWRIPVDRDVEYLEIHGFHQNTWFSLIFIDIYSFLLGRYLASGVPKSWIFVKISVINFQSCQKPPGIKSGKYSGRAGVLWGHSGCPVWIQPKSTYI